MSNFFPFGLKVGTGESGYFPVPDAGCPLEAHPSWNRVVGTGNSTLCWESSDGRSVSVSGDVDTVKNIAFSNSKAVDGMVSATIAYVPTGSTNWLLPLAARMINGNNLLGARWNDGKFEVVQRRNGLWTTIWSGGVPTIGDEVKLIISSNTWRLIVNDIELISGTTNIALSEGYFGVSQHRSGDLDGHTILTDFNVELGKVLNNDKQVTYKGIDVTYFGE